MSIEHIQNSVKDVISYLSENPQNTQSTSTPIIAVMEDDLRCRATGKNGETIVTDMPKPWVAAVQPFPRLVGARGIGNLRCHQNRVARGGAGDCLRHARSDSR